MKRILALFLVLCMCLPFAACGGNGGSGTGGPGGGGTEGASELIDNVGEHNFGNEEFVISALAVYEWEIYKEEEEPDACDTAILLRNQRLTDRFNVAITPVIFNGIANDHSADVRMELLNGNDDLLDMVLMQLWLAGPCVLTGMLYDLRSEVPYVKDSVGKTDWWNAKMNDCYSILGRQYVGVCDINLSAVSSTWCILWNQEMASQNNVAKKIDPAYNTLYDAVDAGTWTIDNMTAIVKDFWQDNPNGAAPGERDIDDTYGLSYASIHAREIFTNAFGYDMVINDGQMVPELTTMSIGMVTNIGKIKNLFSARGTNSFTGTDWAQKFANGQSLLYMCTMGSLDSDIIHESDVKFGVLPFPKADTNQKEYYAGTQDSMSTILVPLNLTDRLERTGAMIESMAAESHQSVLPAYYEVILKYNATRDEKSIEMIEKIYEGRRYNLAGIHSSNTSELYTPNGQGLAYVFRKLADPNYAGNPADFWSGESLNYQIRLEELIAEYEAVAELAGA